MAMIKYCPHCGKEIVEERAARPIIGVQRRLRGSKTWGKIIIKRGKGCREIIYGPLAVPAGKGGR